MSSSEIPEQMTAVVLDSYSGVDAIRVEQRPVQRPGKNQVLVKVAAAPINPSDLAFIEGNYGFKKPTPAVPGLEGSGVVLAAGEGWMARYLNGKRVACVSGDKGDGVWAEYLVTSSSLALPLDSAVSLEAGAMSVVNPLTTLALLEIAKQGKHSVVIQTAAASALSQMINRIFQHEGIQMINIVRRGSQVELLRRQGEKLILNSSDEKFDRQLHELCQQYKPHLAFDAISGQLTMQLLSAMPANSKVTVYGGLSFDPTLADPRQLIFEGKSIDGFWLTAWLSKRNIIQNMMLWRRAQKLLLSDLRSDIRAQYPLRAAKQAIKEYQNRMTGGKVLLVPGMG